MTARCMSLFQAKSDTAQREAVVWDAQLVEVVSVGRLLYARIQRRPEYFNLEQPSFTLE